MMSNDTAIASLKEKIDDLNQEAWEVRVNDSTKAFQLSEESVKLARSINYTKGLAEGLRSLGFGYVRLFKNDEAAPLLKESLSLFQSLNDLKGQAVVYEYLGIIERNWGNLGASLELLLKGYALIQKVGSLEIEVTSCYQIGVTYKHLGNHESALDYLYQALSIAKKADFALMEAYAINIIGSIYFDNGDYSHALDCYQQGLVIRRGSHDKWGEAGSLDNIGFTYLKLNDLEKAIDYCNQSLAISQSTDDKKGEANALLHLAEIYQQAGDVKQASKLSNESLEIRKTRGDRRGEAEVLLFLADLHKNRGDVEDHQIFEWLSGALKIAEEIKAQDILSKAYYNLHEYNSHKGNLKESLTQLEAHLQIEKELHKNTINQKVANLEISHKAEVISERNKELTELNEKIEKANAELKIEASLERVRAVAMGMKEPADMIKVCRMISDQLQHLGFTDIRNVQTVIIYPQKHEYLNYQYFTPYDKDAIEVIDYRLHPDVLEFTNQMLASADAYYTKTFEGKELAEWHEYRNQTNQLPDPKLDATTSLHYYFYSIGSGALGVSTYAPLSDGQIDLFKRFRNVFDLAYRRFIDIEKAQAQAREAQIETALERVRSHTMAMHHSEELKDVISVTFEQIKSLDIIIDSCIITLFIEGSDDLNNWVASAEQKYPHNVRVPYFKHPLFDKIVLAKKKPGNYFTLKLSQKENQSFYKHILENSDFGKIINDDRKRLVMNADSNIMSFANFRYTGLRIGNFRNHTYTEEENNTILRFASVFEQTYSRFLDLQKAEAQAREAQIEAALERVRAKVMAMTNSNDLNETSLVFGEQLRKLGIDWQFSYFWLVDESKNENVFWITWPDYKTSFTTYTLKEAEEYFNDCLISWRAGVKIHDNYVPPEGVQEWLDTFQRIADDAGGEAKRVMVSQTFPNGVYYYDAMMKYGSFGICISKLATDEEKNIQCRFAIEFERAYTRFLDLKQAEAQAREAKIEAALERVRSKAMAMHKSEDLNPAVATVFEELDKLKIGILRCGIAIMDKEKPRADVWITVKSEPTNTIQVSGDESLDYHPLLQGAYEAWVKQEDFSYVLQGEDLLSYYRDVASIKYQLPVSTPFDKEKTDQQQYYFNAVFQDGSLFAFMETSITDEAKMVMKRFANVFNLTYKRFLDLQKAEAQAREARIETALEKVRASTMAMQKSEDLSQTAFVLFNQFKELGEAPERIFIATFDDHDNGLIDLWGTDQGGNQLNKLFKLPVNEPTMVSKIITAWKQKKRSVVVDLKGEELKTYLGFLKQAGIPVAEGVMTDRRVQTAACFSNGVIGLTTPEPQTAEAVQLQERFASVFDLAYTRFLDLQKAEAQTHKANIETALERVRARALAMQQPEELIDVAKVLRHEMGLLGVEELETSSIYIHDETMQRTECWYALKDIRSEEKKLVSDHFPLNLQDTWVGREMEKFYQSDAKQISIIMQGANRKEWINYCEEKSIPFRGYYGEVIPDRTYHLYKFSHGAIGAAAAGDISAESWDLLQRAASVFSLAYSRFKDLTQARIDLQRLKEEKQRAEEALSDLQATQKQLIQSEKMASLGELTAGIAHEIQNPLNFVNNFSDVSNELLEEMKQELSTGNTEHAIEIVDNVKDNLEKILHHGKRADAIVKSMLQHSRSSAGKKEPTDINSLAEEYFRLAFHGLRAKDKSFNAKFETSLDNSIGKINVISQDVGRVILNLINNAFYAVNEKKNKNGNGYEPMVTIATKKLGDRVEIKVKDNGDGIPQKVLDKIFQPFFTTKPTGQGTGLGLSLSYDIITKGHGGELHVKTKEGEGSEFIISLPMNN